MDALSDTGMDLCNLGEQRPPDFFRLPHSVGHQAYVGRTNSQFVGDASVKSKVTPVNAQQMVPI